MILTVKGVTKKFGGLTAVDNVSFELKEGSLTGLIGPNGAGKTTLFNCIAGQLPLSSGSVEFNGTDITSFKSHNVAKLGLMRTFQIVRPFKNVTTLENVLVGAFQKYPNREKAEEKAIESLDFLDILQHKDRRPKSLPLAIKKKIGIAKIISAEPKMVLLDEVMAGLNPQETDEVLEIIKKIHQLGVTVLLIEHKMRCIMDLSEKVIVLNEGAKIAHDVPKDVVENPEVIKAYLGEDYHA